jgi:L-threonylcarbamoyladenylate synthase
VALALLKACNLPIAAPSANRSGKPSPTSAKHVFDDMDGRIPLIIDGGESDVGLESTVISLVGEKPCILRPGGVTKEMLEAADELDFERAAYLRDQIKEIKKEAEEQKVVSARRAFRTEAEVASRR